MRATSAVKFKYGISAMIASTKADRFNRQMIIFLNLD
jgi:hypothetical protein